MADVLIRGIDPEILERIKASAKSNHRSLQRELHEVLRQASVLSLAQTRRLSRRWLRRLRDTKQSDSVDLIRQDRRSR